MWRGSVLLREASITSNASSVTTPPPGHAVGGPCACAKNSSSRRRTSARRRSPPQHPQVPDELIADVDRHGARPAGRRRGPATPRRPASRWRAWCAATTFLRVERHPTRWRPPVPDRRDDPLQRRVDEQESGADQELQLLPDRRGQIREGQVAVRDGPVGQRRVVVGEQQVARTARAQQRARADVDDVLMLVGDGARTSRTVRTATADARPGSARGPTRPPRGWNLPESSYCDRGSDGDLDGTVALEQRHRLEVPLQLLQVDARPAYSKWAPQVGHVSTALPGVEGARCSPHPRRVHRRQHTRRDRHRHRRAAGRPQRQGRRPTSAQLADRQLVQPGGGRPTTWPDCSGARSRAVSDSTGITPCPAALAFSSTSMRRISGAAA